MRLDNTIPRHDQSRQNAGPHLLLQSLVFAGLMISSIRMKEDTDIVVLKPGEFYHRRSFGPETINRGAVLLECEWNGGTFESGVFLGGRFRDGQFLGGTFWGGLFWSGTWVSGCWESGFDRNGRYRPRTNHPPYEMAAAE